MPTGTNTKNSKKALPISSCILISGTIGDETVTTIARSLCGSRPKIKNLIVGIYSDGGDTAAGYAIQDLIRVYADGATIHTVNMGDTSSAAFDIYMMGDKRYGTRFCEFTIHRGYIEPDGRYRTEDLKEEAQSLKQDDLILFNETLADVKLPKNMREKIIRGKDVTLSSKQAKRYGIINAKGLPWK